MRWDGQNRCYCTKQEREKARLYRRVIECMTGVVGVVACCCFSGFIPFRSSFICMDGNVKQVNGRPDRPQGSEKATAVMDDPRHSRRHGFLKGVDMLWLMVSTASEGLWKSTS